MKYIYYRSRYQGENIEQGGYAITGKNYERQKSGYAYQKLSLWQCFILPILTYECEGELEVVHRDQEIIVQK